MKKLKIARDLFLEWAFPGTSMSGLSGNILQGVSVRLSFTTAQSLRWLYGHPDSEKLIHRHVADLMSDLAIAIQTNSEIDIGKWDAQTEHWRIRDK
jgi:hypothetical protein